MKYIRTKMNKGLEAFYKLKESIEYKGGDFYCANQQRLDIIETELKRLEEARDMWKGIADNLKTKKSKQDKVLRIIKENNIIKLERHKDTNRCYLIYTFDKVQIANDEFELLKEWLKHE